MTATPLPELHFADWRATKETLHLYAQIVGKIQLATTAPRNHWWHAALYTDIRGLTTRRLRHRGTTFELTIDFLDDALVVATGDGRRRAFQLEGLSVADFDARIHTVLDELGVDVEIKEVPFGLPTTTPFQEDREHAAWDGDAVRRFGRVLDWSDLVLEEFSGWFNGKTSPVHFFWHSFDLAVTRFSGRRAAPPPGHDPVNDEAYSHEVISFGFWPGDDTVGDAAYYSYTAPEPAGLRDQPLPVGAWTDSRGGSLAVLPYEAVRAAPDPRTALLAFCQGAYEAGARLAGWDTAAFSSRWCPTPAQLEQLQATTSAELGRPVPGPARAT
jgi:uncharacterized protein DUF5996